MSAPPNCTIGYKYFQTSFDDITGYTLYPLAYIDNSQLRTPDQIGNAIYEGLAPYQLGELEMAVTVQLHGAPNQSTMRITLDGSNISENAFVNMAINANGDWLFQGDMSLIGDGSGTLGLTNPYVIKCTTDSNESLLSWYLNDVLFCQCTMNIHSESLTKSILLEPDNDLISGESRFNDWYIVHPYINGIACGSTSYHREIVSSTAKISHSRILQEERNLIGAQNFHNIMKDL